MKEFKGFDKEWTAWLPEGIGEQWPTVGVALLAKNEKVETKMIVAP